MKKYILIKENGVTTRKPLWKNVHHKAYLLEDEMCYDNIIHFDKVAASSSEKVQAVKQNLHSAVYVTDKHIGANVYINGIKQVKTVKDYYRIVRYLYKDYSQISDLETTKENDKQMTSLLKSNPDLVFSVLTKELLLTHYYDLVCSLNEEEINRINECLTAGTPLEEIMDDILINMDNVQDKTGLLDLAKKIFSDTFAIAQYKNQKHLCGLNCQNVYCSKCAKVADRVKRTIDQYPFIKDGYQIVDKNDDVLDFNVAKCDNYKKFEEKNNATSHLTQQVEDLATIYFDASNVDEAIKIKSDLENRGLLIPKDQRHPVLKKTK